MGVLLFRILLGKRRVGASRPAKGMEKPLHDVNGNVSQEESIEEVESSANQAVLEKREDQTLADRGQELAK